MPFGGHIADVARQGFWASLTGGWYYEPAHSLFCNTLHLYIWTILFLLPILFGLYSTNQTAGQISLGLALGYAAILCGIFVLIKLIVSWLHHIFDTVQPIKYKSKRSVNSRHEEQTNQQRPYRTGRFSGSSFSATRATESNALDIVEMLEMHPRSDLQNIQIESIDEREANNKKYDEECGDEEEHSSDKFHGRRSPRYLSLPRSSKGRLGGLSAFEDEGEQSSSSSLSTSSKCSAHGLLSSATGGSAYHHNKRGGRKHTILRTADSLDLLPVLTRSTTNRMPSSERGQKLSRFNHKHPRKFSEPSTMNFACSSGSMGRGWRQNQNKRRRSEERLFAIRRVNSTNAHVDVDLEKILKKETKTTLALPKSGSLGTHFPGGILVDELDLNRWNWAAHQRASQRRQKKPKQTMENAVKNEEENASGNAKDAYQDVIIWPEKEASKEEEKTIIQNEAIELAQEKEEEYSQEPCCSSSVLKNDEAFSKDKEVKGKESHQNAKTIQPGTSELNAAESATADAGTSNSDSEDLKGQITKFLEEMIEKHPDTLMDAIESVRMNRLFQQIGARHRVEESSQQQPQITCLTPQTAASIQQQKHHLALDPLDTTQGAVHAFQDEKGNWYTYSFGEQSSGTAQPLITANEMFRQEEQRPPIPQPPTFQRNHPHRQLVRSAAPTNQKQPIGETALLASQQHGLPVTATVVLEHSPSRSRRNVRRSVHDSDLSRCEEGPSSSQQQPTTVNVVHHRRRRHSQSSSSSLSSLGTFINTTMPNARDGIGICRRTTISQSRSSSSDSAARQYLPHAPTSVIRATAIGPMTTTGTANSQGSGTMNLDIASRSTGAAAAAAGTASIIGQRYSAFQLHQRQLSESSHQLIAFMQRICQGATENPDIRARMMGAQQGRLGIGRQSRLRTDSAELDGTVISVAQALAATPSPGSPSINTVRLLNDLQMNRTLPPPFLFNFSRADPNRSRLKYCYRLKMPQWMGCWWPFGGTAKPIEQPGDVKPHREFKLKFDRLLLASLFDRNHSALSCIFDVLLALFVGILAIMILSRDIYAEFSLLAFAFVIAGAQFSLLKSVQPDSASPVHGFNYLVAYSRPIYFCILALILLLLDWIMPTFFPQYTLAWHWHPTWLKLYNSGNFVISPRDICSNAILWLPIAFTMGLLPQVNTLCMHVLEQLDMHLFGSTASLTLFSATFSLCRSSMAIGILIGLFRLIQQFAGPIQIVNTIGFSAFIAITLSSAYLLSRASSNPLFARLVWKAFLDGCTRHGQQRRNRNAEQRQQRGAANTLNSSNSTLTAPPANKQLLRCCISGSAAAAVDDDAPAPDAGSRNPNPTAGRKPEKKLRHATIGKGADEVEKDRRAAAEKAAADDELLSGISIQTLVLRTQHDVFSAIIRTLILFGLHCTLVFQSGQPHLERVLALLCIVFGAINHHIYPQLRAKHPWKLFSQPFLRSFEFHQFETTVEAKLTIFERMHVWMLSLEKNILYPLLIASMMSTAGIRWNLPTIWAPILLICCAFRLARTGFSQPQQLYVPLFLTCWIHAEKFGYNEENLNEGNLLLTSPIVCLFLATIFWSKLIEFLLKMHFILCYLAPWQISWGSAFHAFAQPFSVPHSGLILAQTIISSILSAPLNPFLGSSFFLMSYVRPVKFWERDYNTKRVDHSRLRLASQLDRGPMVDDSNLNAIFYEHLTRSLQKWLAGDLLLGRWACSIRPGDCFILASNYLNCMVQLVEIGNGFVTFQLRGLEFRGTYCHQREMEAISEDWADANGACCCCSLGRLPGLISFNNAWTLRWLAWEVTVGMYVVDGYSISDNSAVNMLQVHELRRLLVTLYVKCMIYYAINSPNFDAWLMDETVLKALEPIRQNARFVDPDPVFCAANDEDYDLNLGGLSRQSFVFFYGDWIQHCLLSRQSPLAVGPIKPAPTSAEGNAAGNVGTGNPLLQLVNAFAFALSILGRRALGTAAYNRHANAAESFLFGMQALFKGDMRITHPADEWVFTDPEILSRIISPAVRMALKLHQDHFAALVDLDEPAELYERINSYKEKIFISHEHDPAWRRAILNNTPSLLALRHICDDGQDDYKVIMLNKRHLDMRVIKLNRECVRAFWAGQQQELIFLRNKNPERGSIQNARQVLRNMINSSADQPIGYPIYVSPLVTSFVETHPQLNQVLGPTLTFNWCWNTLGSLFARLRSHFGPSGSSSVQLQQQASNAIPMAVFSAPSQPILHQQQSSTLGHSLLVHAPPVPPHQSGNDIKGNTGHSSRNEGAGMTAPSGKQIGQIPSSSIGTCGFRKKSKERVDLKLQKHRRQPSTSHSYVGVETATSAADSGCSQHQESSMMARRSSAADATMPTGKHEDDEDEVEDEEWEMPIDGIQVQMNMAMQQQQLAIVDPEKILPRLNEPLRASGECLVQWPSEFWRTRGGACAWPPDWKDCMKQGRLVHRWIPFNSDRAARSHAGQICLLEVANMEGGDNWFVPVMEEGTRRIQQQPREHLVY